MTADEIRASADHTAIRQLLDSLPAGSQIGPRPAGSIPDSSAGVDSLPKDAAKRLQKLMISETAYRKSLETSIARYDDVKERGVDAISDGDLLVAYCVSGPMVACRCTMELLSAHISYYLSILEILGREISRLDETIPPGYQCVEVILPVVQAYEVKLWAKAAEPRLAKAKLQARLNAKGKKRDSE